MAASPMSTSCRPARSPSCRSRTPRPAWCGRKARRGAALKAARPRCSTPHLRRRFRRLPGRDRRARPAFHLSAQPAAGRPDDPRRAWPCRRRGPRGSPDRRPGPEYGPQGRRPPLPKCWVSAARLGEDIGSDAVLERYTRWRSVDNLGVAIATEPHTLFPTKPDRPRRPRRRHGPPSTASALPGACSCPKPAGRPGRPAPAAARPNRSRFQATWAASGGRPSAGPSLSWSRSMLKLAACMAATGRPPDQRFQGRRAAGSFEALGREQDHPRHRAEGALAARITGDRRRCARR